MCRDSYINYLGKRISVFKRSNYAARDVNTAFISSAAIASSATFTTAISRIKRSKAAS